MKHSFLSSFVLAALALLATTDAARANSLLISPNPNPFQRFSVQGDCPRNGIDPTAPNIDLTRATWACSGTSSQMLRIFYSEGPQECVYIDNFNNDNDIIRAFFVPLQTSDEWNAFAANLPGGVRLRYGCPGGVHKDPCGNLFTLPDAPASENPDDTIRITTENDYEADFICPVQGVGVNGQPYVLSSGCGEWQQVHESGNCGITHIPETPNPNPPPPIPIPGTEGNAGGPSGGTVSNGNTGDSTNAASTDTGNGGNDDGATTGIPSGEGPSSPPISLF